MAFYRCSSGGTPIDINFNNEMVCTPFRNTQPSGGTLTFEEAGTYIISYSQASNNGNVTPVVVSGSMTILKTTAPVASVNNFTGTSSKMYQRLYIAEVTAGTVIRGVTSTAASVGYAVKID